jgi:UDP-N-acetyl-D-galactosamine dehydrogenase
MLKLPNLDSCIICVVGLGYVGLPLAVEFAKRKDSANKSRYRVIGYDINIQRVNELKKGIDYTQEIDSKELSILKNFHITNDIEQLFECDVFIVTVPTPINEAKEPDLSALISASRLVGSIFKKKSTLHLKYAPVVIYESTVFPGATEDICIPQIELTSGLINNKDFYTGYSPERVNPGDKTNTISSIVKVTSGSSKEAALFIDNLYKSIIKAGTFLAKSIKTAEAAKVIENTQRDLNVALVNELSIIFKRMDIDTLDVIEAASTKWNFLPFKPGLVGGHCIGVDPYYLLHKAETLGYSPQVVLSGRRINDNYGHWIVEQLLSQMIISKINPATSRVLILGYTFKEDCPDTRNTRVLDIVNGLIALNVATYIVDPYVNIDMESLQDSSLSNSLTFDTTYDAIVVTVAHSQFKNLSIEQWKMLRSSNSVILDIKGIVPRQLNPWRV